MRAYLVAYWTNIYIFRTVMQTFYLFFLYM